MTTSPNGAKGTTHVSKANDETAITYFKGIINQYPTGTKANLMLASTNRVIWAAISDGSGFTGPTYSTYTMQVIANGTVVEEKRSNQSSDAKAIEWLQTQVPLYDHMVTLRLMNAAGNEVSSTSGSHVLKSTATYAITVNGEPKGSKTGYDDDAFLVTATKWFDDTCNAYYLSDRLQLDKVNPDGTRLVITAHTGNLASTGEGDYGIFVMLGGVKGADISWNHFMTQEGAVSWFNTILTETDPGVYLGLYLGGEQIRLGQGSKSNGGGGGGGGGDEPPVPPPPPPPPPALIETPLISGWALIAAAVIVVVVCVIAYLLHERGEL